MIWYKNIKEMHVNKIIDEALIESLSYLKNSILKEAMEYSLMSGGKRLRPRILLAIIKDYNLDYKKGLPMACSLEMVHTYSLVHDDLPAMDDDDYRRHRLTNHKVYGEANAILTGDALLTHAFHNILRSSLDKETILLCTEVLARNAGLEGMIYGQELDIENKMKTLDDLIIAYEYKTGRLFASAFEMAVIIAGEIESQDLARNLGNSLGVLFQVQDDLLEYTESFETIGKSTKSDQDAEKVSVVTLLGLDKAVDYKEMLIQEFYENLELLNLSGSSLKNIIDQLVKRAY